MPRLGTLNQYICTGCAEPFTSYHKRRVFCSIRCKSASQLKQKVLTTCATCGTLFSEHASVAKWRKLRGRDRAFCTTDCLHASVTGENSRLWRADRKSLKDRKHSLRQSNESATWRRAVFERDNFTCMECGARSQQGQSVVLNPHHIHKFSTHPGLMFETSNGITLCVPCHKETFGKEESLAQGFIEKLRQLYG